MELDHDRQEDLAGPGSTRAVSTAARCVKGSLLICHKVPTRADTSNPKPYRINPESPWCRDHVLTAFLSSRAAEQLPCAAILRQLR